MDIFLR